MRWLAGFPAYRKARLTGLLYLLNPVTGVAAMVLLARGMKAQGDAMNYVAAGIYTAVTVLLLDLFWPVQPVVSGVAAVFSLLGCWAPTVAAAMGRTLPVNNFVFFGVYCALIGGLILRSWFLPKAVGVMMLLAGVCWLTALAPAFFRGASPVVMGGGLVGEGSLIGWLLVKGVDEWRWRAQAGYESLEG